MRIESIKLIEDAAGYNRARIPGLAVSGSGTLFAYCELRRSDSDWAVIDVGLRKSTDGGRTFSEREILVSGEGTRTVNNPVMIAAGDTLYFFYCVDYGRVFFMKSTDDGESWSTARDITDEIKAGLGDFSFTCIATGPTHGIALSDGTLLVPLWMSYNEAEPESHHPSVIALLYSRDGGESFRVGKTDSSLSDASECAVARLPDGRVLINIRHEGEEGCRAAGFADGDFSLSDIRLLPQLPDPVCCAGMCALGGGLLFSNCNDKKSRINLTLRHLSADCEILEGLLISREAGYSDVAVSADESTAFVLFEKNTELYLCIIEL